MTAEQSAALRRIAEAAVAAERERIQVLRVGILRRINATFVGTCAAPTATAKLIAQTSRPNSTSPTAAKQQRNMDARTICTGVHLNVT